MDPLTISLAVRAGLELLTTVQQARAAGRAVTGQEIDAALARGHAAMDGADIEWEAALRNMGIGV